MPDAVDPVLAALQEAAAATDAPTLPPYLGKATSAVIAGDVTNPKLVVVFSAEVAGHEVDLEPRLLVALYNSIITLLGDAVMSAQDAMRAENAAKDEQLAQKDADIVAVTAALRKVEAERDELQTGAVGAVEDQPV